MEYRLGLLPHLPGEAPGARQSQEHGWWGEEARRTGRREVCGWLLGTEIALAFCLPQRGIS